MRSLVTGARVAGLALTIACAGGVGWLLTNGEFSVEGYELSGLRYTDVAAVNDAIGLSTVNADNVFLLRTTDMRRRLAALPAVAAADVRVALPDRLIVSITERRPVLRVSHEGATYLVDGDGVVLEQLSATTAQVAELPLIDDRRVDLGIDIVVGALGLEAIAITDRNSLAGVVRAHAAAKEVGLRLVVGARIDPVDGRTMLELGALTPALLGSNAHELAVSVDDGDGYVVSAIPSGWRAVFGHYTATLRPPDMIARQVQCLRTLLGSGEEQIETIYLAPQEERCGTYLPRPTPRVSPSPAPPS